MAEMQILENGQPFFLPGNRTGCLLLHGFTSTPEEVRGLGDCLHAEGWTVYGARLAGHATYPNDLARIRWQDWLATVEDGLALLQPMCDQVYLIGQSLGGIIALLAAARYPVHGVVALATPYDVTPDLRLRTVRVWSVVIPWIFKGRTPIVDFKLSRREKDYPAYPYFPTRILAEVEEIKLVMRAELAHIKAPVLLIQSRKDPSVPPQSAEGLFAQLPDVPKELFMLDDAGHSIVMDAQCAPAFQKICAFVQQYRTPG